MFSALFHVALCLFRCVALFWKCVGVDKRTCVNKRESVRARAKQIQEYGRVSVYAKKPAVNLHTKLFLSSLLSFLSFFLGDTNNLWAGYCSCGYHGEAGDIEHF